MTSATTAPAAAMAGSHVGPFGVFGDLTRNPAQAAGQMLGGMFGVGQPGLGQLTWPQIAGQLPGQHNPQQTQLLQQAQLAQQLQQAQQAQQLAQAQQQAQQLAQQLQQQPYQIQQPHQLAQQLQQAQQAQQQAQQLAQQLQQAQLAQQLQNQSGQHGIYGDLARTFGVGTSQIYGGLLGDQHNQLQNQQIQQAHAQAQHAQAQHAVAQVLAQQAHAQAQQAQVQNAIAQQTLAQQAQNCLNQQQLGGYGVGIGPIGGAVSYAGTVPNGQNAYQQYTGLN